MKKLIKINLAYNLDFLKHGNMICDMKTFVSFWIPMSCRCIAESSGASFALLLALRNGQFNALASVPLMLEYEAVLKRPETTGGKRA